VLNETFWGGKLKGLYLVSQEWEIKRKNPKGKTPPRKRFGKEKKFKIRHEETYYTVPEERGTKKIRWERLQGQGGWEGETPVGC